MAGMVPVRVDEHFDGISSEYYDIVDRLWYDVGYFHRRESEVLEQVFCARPGIVIDAGCGPGRHILTLAGDASRIVGVDFARRMLEIARLAASSDSAHTPDFVQADVRQLPFKSGMVDFVLNFEVLEHLPEPLEDVAKTLREFRRILRSNGLVLTDAPLVRHRLWERITRVEGSWKELSRADRTRFYESRPLTANYRFREPEIEGILRKVGLRTKRRFYVRVIPAGLIERFPRLARFDRILERIPFFQKLAREAIWLAQRSDT